MIIQILTTLSKLRSYFRAKHDHQFLVFEERSGSHYSLIFWGPQNRLFWYGPSRLPLGERTFLGEMHEPMSSSFEASPFAGRVAEAVVRDDPSVRTDMRRLFEKMKERESELGETQMCKVYLARITTSRGELAENPYEASCYHGYDYPF
jgi:hypothetical protein